MIFTTHNVKAMGSAVHTGLGGGVQRINNSPLDCLEHNDSITYIHFYISGGGNSF
jgi:hypothetical protein